MGAGNVKYHACIGVVSVYNIHFKIHVYTRSQYPCSTPLEKNKRILLSETETDM